MKYSLSLKEKTVRGIATLRISQKNSTLVCRAINKKRFPEAKGFLERLKDKKTSINGKYFTKTVEEISKFLKQLEDNARAQNIDPENMFLFISSYQGPTMRRGRRRWKKFGTQMKICHVQGILGEKNGVGKKVRERGNKK